ncbi:MAG: hypothetical protein CBC01_03460 [Betaproteobacteria bacterium TMED41]|nr:MAG: hypothetical protein CBC01_03460 [Betaproteobacteria bacterium TMED41]
MSKNIGELHLTQELSIFQEYFSKKNILSVSSGTTNIYDTQTDDFFLASTIARIIDCGINGVLPNWLALKNELYKSIYECNKNENHPLSNDLCFSPKLILHIVTRHIVTKLEYFEKYQLVFIPGFNSYIATLKLKNPKNNSTENFAIGTADGFLSPKIAAKTIILEFNKACFTENTIKKKLMLLESGLMDFEEMEKCFI